MILAALLLYWVQPCPAGAASGCLPDDPDLGVWAMQAWQRESGGALRVSKVDDEKKAQIRLYWAGARDGLYGEARPIPVDGKQGSEVYVRPAAAERDALLRSTIVYLTCLHETGHALGLAHTAAFEDIMYNFQYGGDIPEYFGRYRRKLKVRADIRANSGVSETDRKRLAAALRE